MILHLPIIETLHLHSRTGRDEAQSRSPIPPPNFICSYDLRRCNETCRGQILKHGGGLAVEVVLSIVERIPFRHMHNAVFVLRWTIDRVELQGLLS